MTIEAVEINPDWAPIAVRMADEGVPVVAIARSLGRPSGDVRQEIKMAILRSEILAMPRDDWPPGSSRNTRTPDCPAHHIADPVLIPQLMRAYAITGTEAKILGALLRRSEMMREALHDLVQKPDKETNIKIIDVFMCKLRRKLKKYDIYICTIWGKGYYLDPDARKLIFEKLAIPASEGPEAGAVAQVVYDNAGKAPSGGMVRRPSKAA